MITTIIPKTTPHYEARPGKYTYRYGYKAIEGDDVNVSAALEETRVPYSKEVIHSKVTNYCKQIGIPDEWDPADYGFVGEE